MKHTLHITVPYQSVRYCNYCSGAITLTLLATLPRGALGGVVRPTNTRREPSSFEIPPSSAPPTFNQPQERLYVVNSGLTRLDNGYQDTYEPGTLAERAYMRPMASIYQPNSMEDAATVAGRLMEEEVLECIEVDCN